MRAKTKTKSGTPVELTVTTEWGFPVSAAFELKGRKVSAVAHWNEKAGHLSCRVGNTVVGLAIPKADYDALKGRSPKGRQPE